MTIEMIKTESDKAEALRLIRKRYADGEIEETAMKAEIEEINALKLEEASANTSGKKASWMTEEDVEMAVSRPDGFLEKEDMVKIQLNSTIIAMKFYKDGGKTPLVLGDDDLMNTLAIKEALEGEGAGYLELANGVSVSLNSNSLPKDNFGKFVMPNLGDAVRVARLTQGQCTITSQNAPIGRVGSSPYRIFEHEGVRYAGVVKPVTYKLLSVGSAIDKAKLEVLSSLQNISAQEALTALGF